MDNSREMSSLEGLTAISKYQYFNILKVAEKGRKENNNVEVLRRR